jgi:hypothetical protein
LINIDKLIYIFYLLTPFLKIEKKNEQPLSFNRQDKPPAFLKGWLSFFPFPFLLRLHSPKGERKGERKGCSVAEAQ